MTAAGISMELPPTSTPTYSRPGTDELRTLDDNDVRTRPPPRSGPLPEPVAIPATTLAGTPVGERASSPTFRERRPATPRPPSNPSVSAAPLPPPPTTPPPIREAMPPMQPVQPMQPMMVPPPPPIMVPPPLMVPMPRAMTPNPAGSGTRRRGGRIWVIVVVAVVLIGAGAALWFGGVLS